MPSIATFGGIYMTALIMMVAVTSTMEFHKQLSDSKNVRWSILWYFLSGFANFYWAAERIMNGVH